MTESPTSQIPRRFVFGAGGAALAVGVTQALSSPAEAAAAATPWVVGGTDAIATDGTNFLGPLNVAPLIFKTKANAIDPIKERMRISPNGRVGIGTTLPACLFEAKTSGTPALQGNTTSASGTSVGVNGLSTNGYGVQGQGAVIGVYGTGNYGTYGVGTSYGAYGSSSGGYGVSGSTSSGYGVYGSAGSGVGVNGYSSSSNGVRSYSSSGTALYADGGTYGLESYGVSYGLYASGSNYGVQAHASGGGSSVSVYADGGQYGVRGVNGTTAGVRGDSGYVGVWGEGASWGMYAVNTAASGGYGVMGVNDNTDGYAVYALGNCAVQGTLSKSAGSFKIDHPLDPERQWLSHSFVESPDMMNIYNGTITTGADGHATVKMPSYFHALNQDFRYQLTVIGEFAQAIVKTKLHQGAFVVATDKPNIEVSWQVTGIRHDEYAKAHPIVVETDKKADERGTRAFVPKGSSARKMTFRPDHTAPGGAPTVAPRKREHPKQQPAPLPVGVPDGR